VHPAASQFTFNNMVEDSTHTHERVAYRMYATAGVTAPRANLAKLALHVQGQPPHYASYLNLEGYNDKRFLEEIFPSGANGTLWDLHDPPVFGWEQGVGRFLCKKGCAGGPLDTQGKYGMYSRADNARLQDLLSKAKKPEQFFTEMDKAGSWATGTGRASRAAARTRTGATISGSGSTGRPTSSVSCRGARTRPLTAGGSPPTRTAARR